MLHTRVSYAHLDMLKNAGKELGTTGSGFVCLCIEHYKILAPILGQIKKGEKLRSPNRKNKIVKTVEQPPANEPG